MRSYHPLSVPINPVFLSNYVTTFPPREKFTAVAIFVISHSIFLYKFTTLCLSKQCSVIFSFFEIYSKVITQYVCLYVLLKICRVAQVVNHCMLAFVAVQAGVIWIHQILFVYLIVAWTFGWFPVRIIWKGSSDHQICKISCGFFSFLRMPVYAEGKEEEHFAVWKQEWDLARGPASRLRIRSPSRFSDLTKRLSAAQVSQGDGNIPSRDVWTNSSILLTLC